MGLPEISIITTIAVALGGMVMTFVRYGPERRGVLIREEEGSFNILNSLTLTLQNELSRKNEEIVGLYDRVRKLEEENAGLRSLAGRREGDSDAPDTPTSR
jgi:hypothetical protein